MPTRLAHRNARGLGVRTSTTTDELAAALTTATCHRQTRDVHFFSAPGAAGGATSTPRRRPDACTSEEHSMYREDVRTATFAEFLRSPKAVIEQTRHGAVHITRRDGEDLVVLRASDLEHQEEGIGLASRLMRATLTAKGDIPAAISDVFAWTTLLSDSERSQLVRDITDHLWSAAELRRYVQLLAVVRSWRGTAEAYAAGYTRASDDDLAWLDEAVDAPNPRA